MKHTAQPTDRILIAGLLCVFLAGVAMRLVALGDQPYGLYQDEAYNGLDALRVLDGARPLYFPANNGREPLFIYLMALTVGVFGRTPLGVRAAAAILGCLTLPATYLLGTTWRNQRVGLLSATILAAMLWHVHLSRVGFRAIALPLFAALALGLGALGLKTRSRWALAGAGAAYGLSFYTYLPARFTPLALMLMLAYASLWHRAWLRDHWRLLLWPLAVALIAGLPLAILTVSHPDLLFGRSTQVAIWNETIHHGHPLSTALHNALRVLGMFAWRGDPIWRHNVPTRPIFDPLLALAFVGGIALSVMRWKKHPALALSLIWVAVMTLPTFLAEDAPHFLRGVGVLPLVALIPALALDWLADIELVRRIPPAWSAAAMITLLALSAGLTARDYFGCRASWTIRLTGFDYTGCYQRDPVRGYFFQAGATDLAGEALAARGPLYLDQRFWETFPSIRFLVPQNEDLILYHEGEKLPQSEPPLTLIAWPHTDLAPTLAVLPPHAQITVLPGPQTRGDLEPEPYRLYVRWTAEPLPEPSQPLARFKNGLVLLDADITQTDDTLLVTLAWAIEQPVPGPVYTFVHVVAGDDPAVLAQVDEPTGTVYYPPLSWKPGSVIIHPVRLIVSWSAQADIHLRVGLYDPATKERIPIVETNVAQQDNALSLPLDGGQGRER